MPDAPPAAFRIPEGGRSETADIHATATALGIAAQHLWRICFAARANRQYGGDGETGTIDRRGNRIDVRYDGAGWDVARVEAR